MAIQRVRNLLIRIEEQQGQTPINQPRNLEISGDEALEQFQKFTPPKFFGGPDPETAELWLETMNAIFAAMNYPEER